jgi:RHS repeat-associated protein
MMTFYGATENFRLERLLVQQTGASPPPAILDLAHAYDAMGKLQLVDDDRYASGELSSSTEYDYDALGRLTSEDWLPGTTYDDLDLQYDAFGNLSKKAGQTLSYDATKIHQVIDHGSLIVDGELRYDDNGQRSRKATPSKAEVYAYNALGQLVRTDMGPTPTSTPDRAEYLYDYAGRRVQKQVFYGSSGQPILRTFSRFADDLGTGTRTKYYFLGDRLVAARETTSAFSGTWPVWLRGEPRLPELPVAVAVALAGGVLLLFVVAPASDRRRYVGGWVLVAPARAAAVAAILVVAGIPAPLGAQTQPPITHYHLDRLGSVLAVTDATGSVVQQARYRAYGEIRGRFDGGGTPVAESERYRHEYTAWETDVGTSLLYAGARYYDPALGQFLTHDPAMQFASPYALGPGDPVNTADPTGAQADETEEQEVEEEQEAAAGGKEAEPNAVKEGSAGTSEGASVSGAAEEPQKSGTSGGEPALRAGDINLGMRIGEGVRGLGVVRMINGLGGSIEAAAQRNDIDANLIRGIIYEESTHMLPGEMTAERFGFGRTVGIGQITEGSFGLHRDWLQRRTVAVDTIGHFLGRISNQPLINPSAPFSSIATRYNCGSCQSITSYGRRVNFYRGQFQATADRQQQ